MKTWVALAVAGATGVALFYLEKRAAAPVVKKPFVPYGPTDVGPILPQLAPLYKPAVWATVNILNPTTKALRQTITDPLNSTLGLSAPTVVVNDDGTVTRTANGPGLQDLPGAIADGAAGFVHTVGDWF